MVLALGCARLCSSPAYRKESNCNSERCRIVHDLLVSRSKTSFTAEESAEAMVLG